MDKKKKPYETPKLTKFGSVERLTRAWLELGTGDWFNKCLPDDIQLCPWGGCS
jgi:hypothetical protein